MTTEARDRSRRTRAAGGAEPPSARRHRTIVNVVGGVVIVALLAAIALVIGRSLTHDTPPSATGPVVVPAHIAAGAFSVGAENAPVTLDLHYDYMCPACGSFESTNAADLTRLVEDGTLRVNLHVMAFLDEQSNGTEYSTRAGNAYATVVHAAPGRVWAFHNALYASQPHEGSNGLSDSEIADIAAGVGVPAKVVDTFTDGTFRGWVAQNTQDAFDAGIDHTPTVQINGVPFTGDWAAPGELAQAITAAATSGT